MKKGLFWTLAVGLTLVSAFTQRVTGPSYPVKGKAAVGGVEIAYRLPRSAETTADAELALNAPEPIEGWLEWQRYKTADEWTRTALAREGDRLVGRLPRQPAAGKVSYRIVLTNGGETRSLAGEDATVLRFRDPVPGWLLFPHIAVMFAGMLLSTATGLAAIDKKRDPRRLVFWTLALLFLGGFVLGPLVQKFAFGVAWAGFPTGTDLTDTKTLVAFLVWLAAWIAGRKGRAVRPLIVAASLVTLAVFLIPHSLLGSEYNYSQMR
jgi:hypothetical protein